MPGLPNDEVREILNRLALIQSAMMAEKPEKIPLIDPTANVLKLVEQEVIRLNDLADLRATYQGKLAAAESRRVDEQAALREEYAEKLRDGESKRIDAIRAVDVQAAAAERERSNQTAALLANQVTNSADVLRALVTSTADQNQKNVVQPLADRISALEKSQYQTGGRDIQRDVGKGDVRWIIYLLLALPGVIATILLLMKR